MRERTTANADAGITDIECFSRLLRGRVGPPSQDGPDTACWTGRAWVRSRPRLIVRCRGPFDVVEAVRYANARDLRVAVSTSGKARMPSAAADDAVVLDLSAMKRIAVDIRAGRIIAEAGASGRAFDEQAYQSGLTAPTGMIAEASVAETTLDGEHGWLSRRDGLACDVLCAANLVTAQGDYVQVEAQRDPERFWAIRGGGPNFGIVTSLIFRAREVDEDLFGGSISYPANALERVADFYFTNAGQDDDDLTLRLILADVGGQSACTLQLLSRRGPEDNVALAGALRQLATPLADTLGIAAYPAFRQTLAVPGATGVAWSPPAGASYITADMLTPARRTAFLMSLMRWPAKQCVVALEQVGGRINRVPASATAFAHRDAVFRLHIGLLTQAPHDAEAVVRYEDGVLRALGANGLHDAPPGRRAYALHAYAGNYNRLARIKRIDDPDGRFAGNGLFDHLYR